MDFQGDIPTGKITAECCKKMKCIFVSEDLQV